MIKLITQIVLVLSVAACSEKPSETSNKNDESLFTITQLDSDPSLFIHQQKFSIDFEIHEALGSGLASIDIDNDGIYELFFAQYDKNHTSSVLYKFENGVAVDITKESGLGDLNAIMGASSGDVNNDGWADLIVYGIDQLHLMINTKGKFDVKHIYAFESGSFFTSATFFNANNDEHLDLWLSRYVEMNKEKVCKGTDGLRLFCSPSAYPFQKDLLLINNGDGTYKKALEDVITIPASPALGVVAADFNNDNLQDVFVANDGQNNFLFTQQPDGSFIEGAEIKGLSSNLAGLKEASMGVAIGDYDNDGLMDLFLTHLEQETNTLYKNENKWFSDVTNTMGLGAHSRNSTGFGTGFYDLNGDNWLDLFIVNGKIQPIAYQSRENLTKQFSEKPMLYINKKNTFALSESFNDHRVVGRGLTFVDIDNDGDKDIISNNNNQSPSLLRNNTNPDNWYGLNLRCNNRIDYGAKVEFTVSESDKKTLFYRNVHADGSYASASDPRIIITLGDQTLLESVIIRFSNNQSNNVKSLLLANSYTSINCSDS